ncbi:MAG: AAA family ATPase [bacterium]|nr:AAA family ATPase [bacterium]
MKTDNVKKIPYGITDYELIRQGNYYYVDKTRYLITLKDAGRYLFLIRPRRFGKSLFISMMECYYDVFYKDRFEEFFKGTWIYDHPTEDRGDYLVLKFNFSLVNPGIDVFEVSFLTYVRRISLSFIEKYKQYMKSNARESTIKAIDEAATPSDILSFLLGLCRDSGQKLYVIIDEYDNFANTILSTEGKEAYKKLTRGSGSYRAFFNVIKGGADGTGAPFSQLYLTGVSPITLDDVTSGYNIGLNVTIDPAFNGMLGFTQDEVIQMIDYYRAEGKIVHENDYLLEIMTQWYGNYLFSEDAHTRIYNSDMILYFLNAYMRRKKLPTDLVDMNVRTDYSKLRHLIIIDKESGAVSNGNFSKLKEIIEDGGTASKIVKGFPLEQLTDAENFKSLLFYLGLLAIKGPEKDKLRLVIPNETIRQLYYDYIVRAYRETGIFALDLSTYSDLMTEMAYDGKWKPLFKFITDRMQESMSLRDLINGEKSIQTFLNVYLGLNDLYIIHPEKELNKGYADIVMEPFLAHYEGISYSYIIEIKYTKSGTKSSDDIVNKLKTAAGQQLKNYSMDEKFKKNIDKTTLIRLVLIFSGHKLIHIDSL